VGQATDPKQRLWYVFDHALVLPEYLVEFEYEIKPLATDMLIPTEMQVKLHKLINSDKSRVTLKPA
jgi:hypothetical protein